eukprot:gnl/Dysnectes_brevis/5242_a7451_474.p1 GENE.gnl/Dysnectes_brevis/5242_a7451_474~~gnl/Dysnectes_brevis/5242_a7451_474.p1  ORF type:complete len:905 (+),score=236.99 gnl/Dysnectes_brevis/5242_a7451_474:69-2783(+)
MSCEPTPFYSIKQTSDLHSKVEIFKKHIHDAIKERSMYISGRKRRIEAIRSQIRSRYSDPNDTGIASELLLSSYARETLYLRSLRTGVTLDDFETIAEIGAGGYSVVFLVRHKKTSTLLALKQIDKDRIGNPKEGLRIRTERAVMLQISSPFIVSLHYAFQDATSLYFAMDYAPGADLKRLLDKVGALPAPWATAWFAEMVEGVGLLHARGFVHRDLKPQNFLISRTGHILLADFGLAKQVAPSAHPMTQSILSRSIVGTINYMAPEVFQARPYGRSVDLWALGCLAVGTEVLLVDGSVRTVESLAPGECLLGPDGSARPISRLQRGRAVLYTVTTTSTSPEGVSFSDRTDVTGTHTLVLKHNDDTVEMTVDEYMALSASSKSSLTLKCNRTPLRHAPDVVTMSPDVSWLVGYWMTSAQPSDLFWEHYHRSGLATTFGDLAGYQSSDLWTCLTTSLDVTDKNFPATLPMALGSHDNRCAFLAGMMDGCGVDQHPYVVITVGADHRPLSYQLKLMSTLIGTDFSVSEDKTAHMISYSFYHNHQVIDNILQRSLHHNPSLSSPQDTSDSRPFTVLRNTLPSDYIAVELAADTDRRHVLANGTVQHNCILYEMLSGVAAFVGPSAEAIAQSMRNHDYKPPHRVEGAFTDCAWDLICRLLAPPEIRLGGPRSPRGQRWENLTGHPFFAGIKEWGAAMLEAEAPFVPELENETDLQWFLDDDPFAGWDDSASHTSSINGLFCSGLRPGTVDLAGMPLVTPVPRLNLQGPMAGLEVPRSAFVMDGIVTARHSPATPGSSYSPSPAPSSLAPLSDSRPHSSRVTHRTRPTSAALQLSSSHPRSEVVDLFAGMDYIDRPAALADVDPDLVRVREMRNPSSALDARGRSRTPCTPPLEKRPPAKTVLRKRRPR